MSKIRDRLFGIAVGIVSVSASRALAAAAYGGSEAGVFSYGD